MTVVAKPPIDTPAVTGRAKVRHYFIDPVIESGMRRKRGVSEASHKTWLARLADELAYLTPEHLEALQSYAIRWAGGAKKDVWPERVSLLNAAYALQPIPSRNHDYAKSVVRSKMGKVADQQGYLVELFGLARRWGPPPNKYSLKKLSEEGDRNRARLRAIEAEVTAGRAVSADDAKWRDWYEAELVFCRSVLRGDK